MEGVYAIIAVLIGWGLNEFSSYFRNRNVDLQIKNEIITQIILLKKALDQVIKSFESAAKTFPVPEEMEKERQRILQKFVYSDSQLFEELKETSVKLAKINPIEAVKLRGLGQIIQIFEKIKLDNMSKLPELYINHALNLETSLQTASEELSKTIKRLSYSIDIISMVKIRMYLKSRDKNKMSSFLDAMPLNEDIVKFLYSMNQKNETKEKMEK